MELSRECKSFRESCDPQVADVSDGHAQNCASCQLWVKQTEEMISAASVLPQFDVGEQLTQRILLSIEQESKPPLLGRPASLAVMATVCVVLSLFVVPVDSLEGYLSSVAALAGLLLIQLFIASAKTETTAS